jgi:fructose-specific component phosphotransferase system IIB-like protein
MNQSDELRNCQKCLDYLNPPERSLSEVSADEIVEAVLIAVANIPINPALRGDLVYVKDVYAAIRALKGTFSLRASGTPLIERLVTALGSAARR